MPVDKSPELLDRTARLHNGLGNAKMRIYRNGRSIVSYFLSGSPALASRLRQQMMAGPNSVKANDALQIACSSKVICRPSAD